MGACTMLRLPRSPGPRPGLVPVSFTPPSPRLVFPASSPTIRSAAHNAVVPAAATYDSPRPICEEAPIQQFPTVMTSPPVAIKQKTSVQVPYSVH